MRRQLILGSLLAWRCAAQVPGYDGVPRDFPGSSAAMSLLAPVSPYPLANIPSRAILCEARSEPRTVRVEGLAELLGDVLIECRGNLQLNPQNRVFVDYSGYTTTAPPVQQVSIGVTLSTPFTSKLLDGQLTEALLLIDDPVDPSPGLTPRNQNPCAQANGVCAGLVAHSGSGGFQAVTGTSTFQTFIPGSVLDGLAGTAAFTPTGAPLNIFQGRRLNNQTVVFDVPMADYDTRANPRLLAAYNAIKLANNGAYNSQPVIVPWTKRFRIKNLRGSIAGNASVNNQVFANVQLQASSGSVQITSASSVVATVQQGLSFESTPLVTAPFTNCLPMNAVVLSTRRGDFATHLLARYREGHATAFRESGYSSGQIFSLDQNNPSAFYLTESGFYNSRFPATNGLRRAGKADSGTMLRLAISGIPAGVRVFGSLTGTTGTSDTVGAYAASGFLRPATAFATPANVMAAGVSPVGPVLFVRQPQGIYEMPVVSGRATGYWEVYAAGARGLEELVFAVGVGFTLQTQQVGVGTATLQGSFAPTSVDGDAAPSFVATGADSPAFTVSPCPLNISACPSVMLASFSGFYITFFGSQMFNVRSSVRWNPYGDAGFAPNSAAPRRGAGMNTVVQVISPNELRVLVPPAFNVNGGWFELLDDQRVVQVIPIDAHRNPPPRVCSIDSGPTTEGVNTPVVVYGLFPGDAPSLPGLIRVGNSVVDVTVAPGDFRTLGSAVLPGVVVRVPSVPLLDGGGLAVGSVAVNPRPTLNSLDPVLLAAGTTHSSRLRATGGTPPLRWSLQAGTSGAVLRDVPGQPDQQDLVLVTSASIADPQSHSIAVDLQDSLGVSDQVTLAAAIEPLPVLSIADPGPGPFRPGRNTREVAVMVSPRNAFSQAYKGRVWLEGLPTGSEATLVAGVVGRNSMDIDLPACPRTPCPSRVILRLGTVAGALSLRTQTIDVPGVVMPAPLPGASLVVEIPDAPPELSLDRILVAQSSGGLKICAQGVTNTRELVEAQFRFVGTPGSGAGAAFVAPNVSEMFRSFFQPSLAGGSFQFEQNFTVNGNVSEVAAVYVQLRNRAGVTGEVGPVELAKAPRCP